MIRYTTHAKLLLGLTAAALTGTATAIENELGWTLDSALKQVDRQTDNFETLLSDGTVVVRDGNGNVTRSMEGRIYISKDGDIRVNVAKPEEKVLLVTSSEVQEYNPMDALVERYSLSKHKNRMEPYARLGFTDSGKDLKDDYLVTMLGEEKVGDRRALLLELTPKSDSERQIVAKITLWIDEASWMPLRQVIEHVTTNEQLTIDYLGMARNLNLNPELFKSKWPKGTKQVRK